MARNARHRIDPKTGEQRPEQQVGELHRIEAFDENGRVGFFCDEGVQFRNPSSVVVQGVSPVDSFETVIKSYSEISILGEPTDEEYWVDYDQPGFRATTFVNFNPSEVGKYARITYHGLGTVVHPRYFEERTETFRGNGEYTGDLTVQGVSDLQGNVGVGGNLSTIGNATTQGNERVEGSFSTGGSVSLAEDSAAEIQLNAKRAQNAADPVDLQDLVTLKFRNESIPFRNYIELIASGTWTKPADVSLVFVEIIGGGGGGGGSNNGGNSGGGGGGASGEHKRKLLSVTGNVAVVIGAGGAGAGPNNSSTAASDGGDTSFGIEIAAGGKGGISGGMALGGSSNGKLSYPGGNGTAATSSGGTGGNGGGLGGGRGGQGYSSISPESGLANSGAGGGGGFTVDQTPGTGQSGASGGSGIIRIWY